MRSTPWQAAAVALCVPVFVIAACGGASAPTTGQANSSAPGTTQSQAPSAALATQPGLPSSAPTSAVAATPGATTVTETPALTAPAASTEPGTSASPPAGGGAAIAVAAGAGPNTLGGYACAIISDGTVGCWGDNQYGQLGDGTTTASATPVHPVGISSAKAIATSYDDQMHTCAVLSDGTIRCWGGNGDGQLGNGTRINSLVPLQVSGINNAVAIGSGWHSTCAALADGTVSCWGANDSGQLGVAAPESNPTPAAVKGVSGATAIAAAGLTKTQAYACALVTGGSLQCWGYPNWVGDDPYATPGTLWTNSGVSGASAITASNTSMCDIVATGRVDCWGFAATGGLGFPSGTTTVTTPTEVAGFQDAVAIAAGASGTCAVRAQGDLICWGAVVPTPCCDPGKVLGIAGAKSVAVADQICALLADGGVSCINRSVTTPTPVAGLEPGAPVGTPLPLPLTLTVHWDGSACALDSNPAAAAGDASLKIDSTTEAKATLYEVADPQGISDVNTFFATYTGSSTLPAWLTNKADVETGQFGLPNTEALVTLTPGTYAAVCNSGIAGYVVAPNLLVVP